MKIGYSIIYADPPWEYKDRNANGKRGAIFKYPCMSRRELLKLPVADIAASNALLFLWTTAPMIPHAVNLVAAWGFIYKTVGFTWVKLTKSGKPCIGLGHYTRSNAEFVLIGKRGSGLDRTRADISQIVFAERRAHSAKPDEVRERIDDLYPHGRRIELFARTSPRRWDVWGLDAPSGGCPKDVQKILTQ